ncbi:MSHA pilin protein MshD [Sulfuritortus calidifontis]|uniref:MSHA pilin protein MshD n=1 Tax=Sulfuritortus calidifontis TaxID=1914471 RepID=A0A4R3JV67_9PROT|nr:type II secretion system protein [Sulfuritortus calidifontis]TCS71888.1 MSHA pilin protein MshD [Sulfuritortus calidifontis]
MSNERASLIRRQPPACAKQSGVSLVELILFIVIVGIAVAAVLQIYGVTARANADPLLRRQSLAIAQALMEEISYKAASNPPGGFTGPCTPANRWLFDDVVDYSGFSLAGIADLTNVPISGLENYQLNVAVVSAAFGPVPISAGLRITVTVTDPVGESTVLEGYRASYP